MIPIRILRRLLVFTLISSAFVPIASAADLRVGAALIGADQGGIPEAAWVHASQQIAKELDCPVANILMSATHTHSGWLGNGPPPGMFHPDPQCPPPPIVGQLLDDIALASVDAEIYSAIGNRLKQESPMANTVVVTLANGMANSGYIPNDASFGAYTFQVLGSRLKPGCAEDAIGDGLTKQIEADNSK